MTMTQHRYVITPANLLGTARQLLHEVRERNVVARDAAGRVMFEVPATFALSTAIARPFLTGRPPPTGRASRA